jgi:hypothetical protein
MHPGHLALDTRAGWTQTERGAMTKGMERQLPKWGNGQMRLVHSRSKSITHEEILGSSEHTLWGHHTLAENTNVSLKLQQNGKLLGLERGRILSNRAVWGFQVEACRVIYSQESDGPIVSELEEQMECVS